MIQFTYFKKIKKGCDFITKNKMFDLRSKLLFTKEQANALLNKNVTAKELNMLFEILVGVDMDYVLINPNIMEEIEEFLGRKLTKEENSTYYIQKILTEEEKVEFFKSYLWKISLYENEDLVKGAIEAIDKLNEMEYKLYCITSAVWLDSKWAMGVVTKDKIDILKRYFSFKEENIMIMHQKSMVNVDIMVDDTKKNLIGKAANFWFETQFNKKDELESSKQNEDIYKCTWEDIIEKMSDPAFVRKMIMKKYKIRKVKLYLSKLFGVKNS